MAFGNHDTPGQIARRAADATYAVENRYSGETFMGLGWADVDGLLRGWLAEDGYELADGEQWHERRWQGYADGYVVADE